MEMAHGTRIKIRFKCTSQDGTLRLVGGTDILEFSIGAGSVPVALETGLLGMKSGERRTIVVPAGEVGSFPFPAGSHFSRETVSPPGTAYDFGPGNGGDVSLSISKPPREPLPPGTALQLEVELLSVELPGS
jgi:FKBP-type peptidyl-prolyl isomerase-like protein